MILKPIGLIEDSPTFTMSISVRVNKHRITGIRPLLKTHLRLREALGEDNFPLELPKKTLFRDLKNEFLAERSALLNDYLQQFVQIAHERRMIFHILEDFLSIDMYINRKKTIQKRVDSIVSPFKKATRDAGQESTES